MKHYIICILIAILCACSGSTDLEFTVQKDKITFHNWQSKQLNKEMVAIYLWNEKELKVSETKVEGIFSYNQENILEFVPNFPLLENTEYVLVRKSVGEKKQQRFSLPDNNRKSLVVEEVYPTSDTLPENMLRMYVFFSQPMKTTGNIEYIKLLDETGKEIEGAIFSNVYELWDATQKQLTIIFDPARVKTDLIANKELGRALKPGKKFQVVIDGVEDIYGQRLQEAYVKTFQVSPQDVTSPDVNSWEIQIPETETKDALKIRFNAPLDRMSLYTRIMVVGEDNQLIQGKIIIRNNEKLWEFLPLEAWKQQKYLLKVNTRLADPSGNNLNGLFDHKAGSLKSEKEGEIITVPLQLV